MITREAYKRKIEAEVELAQAKLEELKAHLKIVTDKVHIKVTKEIEDLNEKVRIAKGKIKELRGMAEGSKGDGTWDRIKDSVEGAWNGLNAAVRNATNSLKGD